jgi:hypothetical protein
MAIYGKLVAAADFLEGFPSLVSTRATLAETEADVFVNTMFADFDRSLWTLTSVPPEIGQIWLKVASSWYIRQNLVKVSPEQNEQAKYSDFLMAEARSAATTILTRGYVAGLDGSKVYNERRFPSTIAVEKVR